MVSHSDDIGRVNSVIKYIEQNLDEELTLEELSKIAHYSPFHLQRVFKTVIGESPKQYITRLRLEEAAHIIVLSPEKSMLEVALDTGFKSLEAFSRAFKSYYKISPDNFRRSPGEIKLKTIQHPDISENFLPVHEQTFSANVTSESRHLKVHIIRRPALKLVYLQTVLGSMRTIEQNFKKIKQWALVRELVKPETDVFGLIKDYPVFTALDKCRYLTCIGVPNQPEVSGLVNYMEIPQGTYACVETGGDIRLIVETISDLVNNWLYDSEYRVVHEPAIQVPVNDPFTTPFTNNSYKIFVKIRPA